MAEYTARRRLYRGAGDYVEKGEKIELTPAEADRLLASQAVEKIKPSAVKKDQPLANKAEGAASGNKGKK